MGSPRPDLARGKIVYDTANGATQHQWCIAISRNRDHLIFRRFACVPAKGSALDRLRKAVGLHLGPNLRDVMPEHDDVVLLAVDVPDMVAQQRFGLEAEALEQRDRACWSTVICTESFSSPSPNASAKVSCDSARPTPCPRTSSDTTMRISPTCGDQECGSRTSVPQPTTLPVLYRQQAHDGAALDLVDPGRQHLGLADVARQEQQIVRRQFLRESKHGGFVRARHQAEFDVAGIGLDVTRDRNVFRSCRSST